MHWNGAPNGVGSREYISKMCDSSLGGGDSKRIYQQGLSFTRVGDSRSYEVIGNGSRIYSPVDGTVQIDLGKNERRNEALEDGMPTSIIAHRGDDICFKIPASKSDSPSVTLMVNSEDGKSLPALIWRWADANSWSQSITGEKDLTYQIEIPDIIKENDFIYVYLHAEGTCQFVVTASVS